MGVRVAYGRKENIANAINDGTIPKDCIIITKDDVDSELLFYDANGNLLPVEERTRFESFDEAQQWAITYPCNGSVFSVKSGDEWIPFIVQDDNSLAPVGNITRIDGGTAADI